MKRIKFTVRQYLKMFMQGFVLPAFYNIYRRKPVNMKMAVFADSHNDDLPFSMQQMHREAENRKLQVIDYIADGRTMSFWQELIFMIGFMKIYAQARYVFICDNFLPVSSCRKRKETIVIQLWHAGGALKKFGYDAVDDIPSVYKLNPYKNYDLVTVSSEACKKIYSKAMHLDISKFQATGISRTDVYFDKKYLDECKAELQKKYPDTQNKKIILWAPTFRGNAGSPRLAGEDEILDLKKHLDDNFLLLIKVHPHLEKISKLKSCSIPTERLLPSADLLITDYSTVFFDFCLLRKPSIFFVPDYAEYAQQRGFYIDIMSLPGRFVDKAGDLLKVVQEELHNHTCNREEIEACIDFHMKQCDGNATQHIWNHIQKMEKRVNL